MSKYEMYQQLDKWYRLQTLKVYPIYIVKALLFLSIL